MSTTLSRKRRRLHDSEISVPLAQALNLTDLFTFLQTIDRFRVRCVHRRFALLETCWTNVEVDCCKHRTRKIWAKLPTALTIYMKFNTRTKRVLGGQPPSSQVPAIYEFVDVSSLLKLVQGDVTLTVRQLTKDEAHINRWPASPAGGLWQLLHASIFAWRLPPISIEESKRFIEFLQGETFSAPLAAIFPRAMVVVEAPEKLWIGNPKLCGRHDDYGTICVRDPQLSIEWRIPAWDWHNEVYRHVCEKEQKNQRLRQQILRIIIVEARRNIIVAARAFVEAILGNQHDDSIARAFVEAAFGDLDEERRAIVEAILGNPQEW